jgi:hypothetical protein
MFFHNNGLVNALDEFNESVQNHTLLPDAYYDALVEMICTKQLHSGEMRGTIDPGPKWLREGITLYTGERVRTKLATRNIVSLEAGRVLAFAESLNTSTKSALEKVSVSTSPVTPVSASIPQLHFLDTQHPAELN